MADNGAKGREYRQTRFGFVSGLLGGLAAFADISTVPPRPRRYPDSARRTDWERVGRDLFAAMTAVRSSRLDVGPRQ
ncbi:hypothetical protein [Caenispirillum bisanense]|uniref:Uncharacterized protein n=1 Tax=Caenispirillum bisanense TaxID=414052 RepID=A0A286G5N2_9PROT|nr:hypothetical protein [Caenispirillum bisanense]SOD90449.1 hypothetical protein SAMN05421508_101546 [Caenispirillum bisanense]